MKGNDFAFNYVHLLYYKCHKINPHCGGSYINSPDWIKNRKVTINLINKKDNKCFQYVITVALNHEEIKSDPQWITKIKPLYIYRYNKGRNKFSIRKRDLKFEKNNVAIVNIFCMFKKKK